MTIAELIQSVQFVVDAVGNRRAVQISLVQWEELVALLVNVEAWEQEWRRPFDAVRQAWEVSPPAPAEDSIPDDDALVQLVHQTRDEQA
jgi:hypothetical protein